LARAHRARTLLHSHRPLVATGGRLTPIPGGRRPRSSRAARAG